MEEKDNIKKEEIDMDAKASYIASYIASHSEFSFVELLEKQQSKTEIIVAFLVILEMIKIGQVTISQNNIFGDIMIKVVKDFVAPKELIFTAG